VSIGNADIQKTIQAAWIAGGLEAKFADLGGESPALNFDEGSPEHEQPYCVWNLAAPDTETRMSGSSSAAIKQEIRNCVLRFDVHTKPVDGDARGASQIAAYLIEEIMKVFGGHPTVVATADLTMDNGCMLDIGYMRDYCVKTGNNNYQWPLEYQVTVDVPVTA